MPQVWYFPDKNRKFQKHPAGHEPCVKMIRIIISGRWPFIWTGNWVSHHFKFQVRAMVGLGEGMVVEDRESCRRLGCRLKFVKAASNIYFKYRQVQSGGKPRYKYIKKLNQETKISSNICEEKNWLSEIAESNLTQKGCNVLVVSFPFPSKLQFRTCLFSHYFSSDEGLLT